MMTNSNKASKGVRMQTRWTLFVSALLLVVVLAVGATVYQVVSQELTSMADYQLQTHAAGVAKQADLLLQTTDSREFEREMEHYIGGEKKALHQHGWTLQAQLINLDASGPDAGAANVQASGSSGGDGLDKLTLSKAQVASMVKAKSGLLEASSQGSAMMYAYQLIPAKNLLYVAAVPTGEIMVPLAHLRNVTLVVIVVALVISFFFVRWFTKRMNRSLQRVQSVMEKVAAGQLTEQVTVMSGVRELDGLALAVNGMIEHLRALITQVNDTAEQVASASQELLVSAEQTKLGIEQVTLTVEEAASGAQSQANGMAQNAAAVEEMATRVEAIAQTAANVTASTQETATAAEQGDRSIHQTMAQMQAIATTVGQVEQALQRLERRSDEVGQIIEVITAIAAQTHLLALNAAIEAARAGEQGRGFAVVADEVRKLADQSDSSARQIEALIRQMQADTEDVMRVMASSTVEVEAGRQIAESAGQSFGRILQAATSVADDMQSVASAAVSMSDQASQVVQATASMNQSAGQVVDQAKRCASHSHAQFAAVEEVFLSANGLAGMAQDLQKAIGQFQV